MCSIMCYCKKDADMQKFLEGFKETVSRGPDDSRVIELPDGIMGFHRLAIMGLHLLNTKETMWYATARFTVLIPSKST